MILLDSGNKINAMSLAYVKKLDLKTWKTNIGAQKIDSSTFKTFEIIITDFQMKDMVGKPRIFWKAFFVADIKYEVILELFFLKISNANILFG